MPFEKDSIYVTAVSGSAAALLGGGTLHAAAGLNRTKIPEDIINHWKSVRILIIDEISYFSESDFINLDKKLRKIKGVPDKMYGNVPIVLAGDFHQLCPVSGQPVYKNSWSECWHGSVNVCIFLKNDHRFKDDPRFGKLLSRIRVGEATKEDIHEINKRWLGNQDIELPSDNDVCYACPTNKDRNAISTKIFSNLVKTTNPSLTSIDASLPSFNIVIESSIRKGKEKQSQQFHNAIIDNCGDADVITSQNKKVDPALKFYKNIPLMINTNENLEQYRAKGTLCRGVAIKLKSGAQARRKIWDDRLINTVSIDEVEYMLCEHYEDTLAQSKTFRLYPEKDAVTIKLKLFGNIVKIGGTTMTQFPVNTNIATTGHKLQGLSKDYLIVHSWNYSCANWIYVVLSRVRTLSGLFLCEKLNENKTFTCDKDLLKEEERLTKLEEAYLKKCNLSIGIKSKCLIFIDNSPIYT